MKKLFLSLWFSLGLLSFGPYSADAASALSLSSPDGRIEISIRTLTATVAEPPRWAMRFRGQPMLKECGLGLVTASKGELLTGAQVSHTESRTVNERVPVLFGKSSEAQDHFHELSLTLTNSTASQVRVVFRCYNDAVAFRYELPSTSASSEVTITDETTSFGIEGSPTARVQYLENYNTSHEHNVDVLPVTQIRRDALLDVPLTLAWPDHTYVAITEASLRRYAGMALSRTGAGAAGVELVSRLTPRPDGSKVKRVLPMETPWRVVLVGDRAGALLESQTLYLLNEPSLIPDTSWIKPEKITFSWWNGDVYDGHPGDPILSLAMAKRYIDFCARHGLHTHSLTSTENTVTPWYRQSKPGVEPGPDTDVTKPRDGFDLEAIREYARSKGVRLWTWVHQGALRGRVEEAFAAFERLGWSGMMVDFFDHDDQDSVEFAESVLEAAARHHILIHLHGVWKPSGWQRTYPNLMNHEGALNLEYLKWSDRCTPQHDLEMAYTRLIAGPMDYHLGGFRAVRPNEFKPRNIAPNVLGTRCHMLALYVCFDNPAPMVADYPAAYEGQPGFEFIQRVPTWWDETRVLIDNVGEILVVARRRGTTWFLGGITGARAQEITLPLNFLNSGRRTAIVWKDPFGCDLIRSESRFA